MSTDLRGAPAAGFDRIARAYRWMERLTFGPALWRCRTRFLPQLAGRRRALLLGDGNGRFTAALLGTNPHLHADAVDSSAAMLRLLVQRVRNTQPDASARLRTHHADAPDFVRALPESPQYDLIVTHFFLDCFAQREVESLTRNLALRIRPDALWLVSDFRIPTGLLQWPARVLVRSLYLAFRLLTGLRTAQLPNHAAALTAAGFTRIARHLSLGGILTTELWAQDGPSARAAKPAYTPHHATAAATSPR